MQQVANSGKIQFILFTFKVFVKYLVFVCVSIELLISSCKPNLCIKVFVLLIMNQF